jgi:hypothetical protein
MVWDFQQQRIRETLSLYDDDAEHFSPKLKNTPTRNKWFVKGNKVTGMVAGRIWQIAELELQNRLLQTEIVSLWNT